MPSLRIPKSVILRILTSYWLVCCTQKQEAAIFYYLGLPGTRIEDNEEVGEAYEDGWPDGGHQGEVVSPASSKSYSTGRALTILHGHFDTLQSPK
jgi:hypothetical protein